MEKKLEDYLHLYLGQSCLYKNESVVIEGVKMGQRGLTDAYIVNIVSPTRGRLNVIWNDKIKLTLRPLSDMTEEEKEMILTLKQPITDGVHKVLIPVDTPESLRYLLSQGFDLFGLIESGLAIDKTKLKP